MKLSSVKSCRAVFVLGLLVLLFIRCASSTLERKDGEVGSDFEKDEFDKMVKIKEIDKPVEFAPATGSVTATNVVAQNASAPTPVPAKKQPKPKLYKKKIVGEAKPKGPQPHLPKDEIGEGFDGRRPLNDPFWPGEKVELALTYLNIKAGTLSFETRPFVEVNGKKAYNFYVSIKSSSLFNMIYSVDNYATAYVGYDDLLPLSHEVNINESKQLVNSRSYYDWENLKAVYWESKYTREKGDRKRKIEWDLVAYSQNIITAMFYIRLFKMVPGKDVTFHVTDNGKDILFKGAVLRREKITTDLGEFDSNVVKGEFAVDGTFKPLGDVYYWFTNDSRRHLIKIQVKIQIGSFLGELKTLELGKKPE